MKSTILTALQAILFLFCLASAVDAQPANHLDNLPAALINTAETGLQQFFNKLPADSRADYGFIPTDEPDQLSLGTPFKLYTITPASIFAYRSGDTVSSLLTETDLWYFPVISEDQIRSILVVEQSDNQWQAVSLGQAPLAAELDRIKRVWPVEDGFNPRLIVVYQAKQFFFTVPERGEFNLTLISTESTTAEDRSDTTGKYSSLDKLEQVIQRLAPVVETSLQERY